RASARSYSPRAEARTTNFGPARRSSGMARIPPLPEGDAAPEARAILERHRAAYGRVTNMKRTLAHSPAALRALMHWYDLHDEVVAFLGPRAATVFVHAISSATDCLICSTFFRRWLS